MNTAYRSHRLQSNRVLTLPLFSEPPSENGPVQRDDGLTLDANTDRVLVVDDDLVLLDLVSRMTELLGYQPTKAEDAVDALYYLTKTRYRLVIADYDMPSMNGYQLADNIKRNYSGTKVIIMTAHRQSDLIDMLEGSDVIDGLLLKPFDLNTMGKEIETVLSPVPNH